MQVSINCAKFIYDVATLCALKYGKFESFKHRYHPANLISIIEKTKLPFCRFVFDFVVI